MKNQNVKHVEKLIKNNADRCQIIALKNFLFPKRHKKAYKKWQEKKNLTKNKTKNQWLKTKEGNLIQTTRFNSPAGK